MLQQQMTRHRTIMLITAASIGLLAAPLAQAQQTYSGDQSQDSSHRHHRNGDNNENTTTNTSTGTTTHNNGPNNGPPQGSGNGPPTPNGNHEEHGDRTGQSGGSDTHNGGNPNGGAPGGGANSSNGNWSNNQSGGDRNGDHRGDNDHRSDRGDNDRNNDHRADNGGWDASQHNGYSWNGHWYFGQPPASYYGRPGFSPGYHQWRRGDRLPGYFRTRYAEIDYHRYHLRRPPHGYHYVRDDRGEILLVGILTGVILSAILDQR